MPGVRRAPLASRGAAPEPPPGPAECSPRRPSGSGSERASRAPPRGRSPVPRPVQARAASPASARRGPAASARSQPRLHPAGGREATTAHPPSPPPCFPRSPSVLTPRLRSGAGRGWRGEGAGPAEAPLGREHTAPSRCRRAARGHVTRLFRQRPGVHRAVPPQRRLCQSAPARAQAVPRPTTKRRRRRQTGRGSQGACALSPSLLWGRRRAVTRFGALPCRCQVPPVGARAGWRPWKAPASVRLWAARSLARLSAFMARSGLAELRPSRDGVRDGLYRRQRIPSPIFWNAAQDTTDFRGRFCLL